LSHLLNIHHFRTFQIEAVDLSGLCIHANHSSLMINHDQENEMKFYLKFIQVAVTFD